MSQQRTLKSLYIRAARRLFSRNLSRLALLHGSDKFGRHAYTTTYMEHLARRRGEPLVLLELGVGGYGDPRAGGNSLRMWQDYFPRARVYGLDIHPKAVCSARIRVFQGSQVDEGFLRSVLTATGPPDVVIDDASHVSEYSIRSFQLIFPSVREGGMYSVEDTTTSYSPAFGGSENVTSEDTLLAFFKRLTDSVNARAGQPPAEEPPWAREVASVHFYEDLVVVRKC
jgi:hypothetical protein